MGEGEEGRTGLACFMTSGWLWALSGQGCDPKKEVPHSIFSSPPSLSLTLAPLSPKDQLTC